VCPAVANGITPLVHTKHLVVLQNPKTQNNLFKKKKLEEGTGFKLIKRNGGAGEYDNISFVPHKLSMHSYSIRAIISVFKKISECTLP